MTELPIRPEAIYRALRERAMTIPLALRDVIPDVDDERLRTELRALEQSLRFD